MLEPRTKEIQLATNWEDKIVRFTSLNIMLTLTL